MMKMEIIIEQNVNMIITIQHILSFDSKNFNENKCAEFKIIDSFAKLQITYFYDLYYLYYSVYSYGNYFSYIFRLSTKLKDEDFPENFPLKIYIIFLYQTKQVELNCYSNKLSMLEDDYDYQYIISCSGNSEGDIYENRFGSGKYYLQFRSYYEEFSPTAYNPLIMSANPTKINITNPFSVIKIQKYEISYQIIKNFDELKNLEIAFKGIYIKNKPQNIFNDYYDYEIYFITNNKEKLNTKCLINILDNSEVKLICKINADYLENFMELKNGIYNSYIFISKLDIDYVLNYNQNNMIILERFIIDLGGSILISRIDDKTTIDDLKKDFKILDKKDNIVNDDSQTNKEETENKDINKEKDNNMENNNNSNKESSGNKYIIKENKGKNILISRFIFILICVFIYL